MVRVALLGLLFAGCSPAPAPSAPAPSVAPPAVSAPLRLVVIEDAGTPVTVEASPAPAEAPVVDAGARTPRAPTVVITGDCVDPIKDATKRAPHHGPPLFEPRRVDLDGDDDPDWILTTDADAYAYHGYVYITRGSCAHFVGSWEGAQPSASGTATRGVLDLESGSPCKVDCCPSEKVRVMKFDGRAYRKAGERTVTRACKPFVPY